MAGERGGTRAWELERRERRKRNLAIPLLRELEDKPSAMKSTPYLIARRPDQWFDLISQRRWVYGSGQCSWRR